MAWSARDAASLPKPCSDCAEPCGGSVTIDGRAATIRSPAQAVAAGLAYLPEDRLRQGIFRGLSVRANTVISALGSLRPGPLAERRARAGRDRARNRGAGHQVPRRGTADRRALGRQSAESRAGPLAADAAAAC